MEVHHGLCCRGDSVATGGVAAHCHKLENRPLLPMPDAMVRLAPCTPSAWQPQSALTPGSLRAGADFTNAVVDRVAFDGSDLSNSTWTNAVITGECWHSALGAGLLRRHSPDGVWLRCLAKPPAEIVPLDCCEWDSQAQHLLALTWMALPLRTPSLATRT